MLLMESVARGSKGLQGLNVLVMVSCRYVALMPMATLLSMDPKQPQ